MNREIKFKGKCAITGNWISGYYYMSNGHSIIRDANDNECIVLAKTVSEYIGVKDCDGVEIYENDITNGGVVIWFDKLQWDGGGSTHPGFYLTPAYKFPDPDFDGDLDYHTVFDEKRKVLGNIFDNKELLVK